MSATVAELIEAAAPTLERMAVTFQALSKHQEQERQRIAKQMDDAQTVIEPIIMNTLDQFDLFLGKIEEAATAGAADSSGGASDAAPQTPPTNRGVTPSPVKSRKPAPRKASRAVTSREKISKTGGKKHAI